MHGYRAVSWIQDPTGLNAVFFKMLSYFSSSALKSPMASQPLGGDLPPAEHFMTLWAAVWYNFPL
jgi:hypothetical protein